jgi:predicted acyl esterase
MDPRQETREAIARGELASDVAEEMRIDWDVPIAMDDGVVLRADVYRPLHEGKFAVILSYGPYGKWLSFQQGYSTAWDIMVKKYPDTAERSSNRFQSWEVVDPEKWVPDGYVCVRVDSRGAGRSPGFLDMNSPRETRDFHDCIEWAAAQSWSNGKVGLSGISYYGANQWRVAALNPPHLSAMCIWEGFSDFYRETSRHGGILCTFLKNWNEMQVVTVQHGRGRNGAVSSMNGELVCGPETFSDGQLERNRANMWPDLSGRSLEDEFHNDRSPDFSRIDVPLLSAGNWGGQGLHLRGNVEGFLRAGSKEKWLEIHGGEHWTSFYTDYGVELQKKFFGHFLQGRDTGWDCQPRIQLQVRHPGEKFTLRYEAEWPISRTNWTKLFLSPSDHTLGEVSQAASSEVSFRAKGAGLSFSTQPLDHDVEITGPCMAKLFVSSTTEDADIFLVLRVLDPTGEEVTFAGALDPRTPVAQGWLRASHRKLDGKLTTQWRPYHSHDEAWPLKPGEKVELDIEIWPTCIVIPKGYRIVLSILGRDFEHEGVAAHLSNMKNPMRGCGPFVHDDAKDRADPVFDGETKLHFGSSSEPYLLLPIVPAKID